jgi:hypothetical protein
MTALFGCSANRRGRVQRFHASSFLSDCSGANYNDADSQGAALGEVGLAGSKKN